MPPVLLATCALLPDGDDDARLLDAALRASGCSPEWVVWDDPAVDWRHDLVVLRSTWDYPARRARFLAWAGTVARLANPVDVVTWNSDKRYLAELGAAGLHVVPTSVADGAAAAVFPDAPEVVVKPTVGAGSQGVGRFRSDVAGLAAARGHIDRLRAAGYTALVQPYLTDVDTHGETALVYVDGSYSHAARKGAMLPADRVHALRADGDPDLDLYVPETITAREPEPAELAVGARVLAHVTERFGTVPLYARVDLLPSADGPVLVELELVEPSLFLAQADPAAKTFASAIAARA